MITCLSTSLQLGWQCRRLYNLDGKSHLTLFHLRWQMFMFHRIFDLTLLQFQERAKTVLVVIKARIRQGDLNHVHYYTF